jgi:hypothetical protein
MNDQALPQERDLPAGHHAVRRAHLMQTITAPAPSKATRRRILIGGLATAGLATGLAALIIAPTAKVGSNQPVPTTKFRSDQPITLMGATEVFTQAAKAASAQPDLKPRPDQFVYTESRNQQASLPGQPGGAIKRKVWLSADGTHAGLLDQQGSPNTMRLWLCDNQHQVKTGKDKLPPPVDLKNPPRDCANTPAYNKNLPTDPTLMRKWLYRNSKGGNPPDVQAFRTVGDTIRESYIAPKALSAMFTAAAKIPGVTVTRNAVDSAGRKGIAVGQTWNGLRQELIFTPKTYQLLGEREVFSNDPSFKPSGGKPSAPSTEKGPKVKEGTVLYTSATLQTAVVDKAGQPPTK